MTGDFCCNCGNKGTVESKYGGYENIYGGRMCPRCNRAYIIESRKKGKGK